MWSMESSVTWGVEAKDPHSNDRDGAWENPGPIGKEKAVAGEEVAAEQDGSAVEGVRASDYEGDRLLLYYEDLAGARFGDCRG